MSGTYTGNISTAITLSAAFPTATIAAGASINAYGSLATYAVALASTTVSELFSGSVFGPTGTHFTLNNAGFVETNVTSAASQDFDAGILLGSGGEVINSGTILAPAGRGVDIFGAGTILNSGLIAGGTAGSNNGVTIYGAGPSYISNSSSGSITGSAFAVYLKAASTVTNAGLFTNAGQINGAEGGFYEYGVGGTIINTGTISAFGLGTPAFGDGIFIGGGSDVINGSSTQTNALISGVGNAFGIDMTVPLGKTIASVGTVINYGTIHGGSLAGVQLKTGTIINGTAIDHQALITGVVINGGPALIKNFGTINGNGQTGPALSAPTTGIVLNGATNDTTVLIESTGVNNVKLGKTTSFTNYGSIIGGSINGIYQQSGVITNASSGIIIGGRWGAHVAGYGAATVVNAGTIEGSIALGAVVSLRYLYNNTVINSGALISTAGTAGFALQLANGNNLLIDDPGAVFVGTVAGGIGVDTLMLASAASAGTLTGFGSQFVSFSALDFNAGAQWTAQSNTATGFGTTTIAGFVKGDTIILQGFTETSKTYVSGVGLELTGASTNVTLDITGTYGTPNFTISNAIGGTTITVACFVAGTRIATARGRVPVQQLRVGDLVYTANNGLRPIRWIGSRAYDGRFIAGNRAALPVRLRRHALGLNVPSRDLFVSPDHAIYLDGALVNASRLVNNVSITQASHVDRVEYFHFELDSHDIVFAHNTPTETFLDADCRARFAATWGEPGTATEPCHKRLEDGYELATLQARINARAGIVPVVANGPLRGCVDEISPRLRGWAQDISAPEAPVELEVLCNGQVLMHLLANRYREDLWSAALGSGCHGFDIPAPPHSGRLTLRRAGDGAILGQSCAAA